MTSSFNYRGTFLMTPHLYRSHDNSDSHSERLGSSNAVAVLFAERERERETERHIAASSVLRVM